MKPAPVMTGDGSYDHMKNAHTADLNLVQCQSFNQLYSWNDENQIRDGLDQEATDGLESIKKSLMDIALYFDDPELLARTEAVIAEELDEISAS